MNPGPGSNTCFLTTHAWSPCVCQPLALKFPYSLAITADQARLRDEYNLDSMDALGLLAAVQERAGASIPEADYARMHGITELLDYLEPRAAR
ncbi:MAG: acyl carrier protein [Ectothiorhodospiraceae bacterium]|nr:acyl carrier protein [Ectothiorhodospiraceae bacterium]